MLIQRVAAHYPPGAEHGYDYNTNASTLSFCETFQRPTEGPKTLPSSRWVTVPSYQAFAGDDTKFYVYWFQSHTGYGNDAKDLEGHPMKNWWPFMYY